MSIKPFDLTSTSQINLPQVDLPDELNDILKSVGAVEESKKEKISSAREVFTKSGASVQTAAQTVSAIMQRADTDSARLRAVELTMKVHGILEELDGSKAPTININVGGDGSKTLINLVLPTPLIMSKVSPSSTITQHIPLDPKRERVYVGFYKYNTSRPLERVFSFKGDLKGAKSRFFDHCKRCNYEYISVNSFIVDLDHIEETLNQSDSN